MGATVERFFSRQGGASRWVPAPRRTDLDEAQALVVLAGWLRSTGKRRR